MTTNMVRKQIYIHKRQDAMLKQLSKMLGVSEAEIIRQAIEGVSTFNPEHAGSFDEAAFQEFIAFIEERKKTVTNAEPYRWNREEIYAERENRWIREEKDKGGA